MSRIFQAFLLVFLVLDVVNSYPWSTYQTYLRLFGRHLRKVSHKIHTFLLFFDVISSVNLQSQEIAPTGVLSANF